MPDAECRFLGLSWSAGRHLRRRGMDYAYLPWRGSVAVARDVMPPVAEFLGGGFTRDQLPARLLRAWGAACAFVEREIERFLPQVVVYGPAEHGICWLVDGAASARGMAKVGIQPCHLKGHFIAHPHGSHWQDILRSVTLPGPSEKTDWPAQVPSLAFRSQSAKRRNPLRWSNWERALEYAARAVSGGNSFHTIGTLSSWIASRLAPRQWFPELETLSSTDNCGTGCVLVALHRPSISWGSPTWIDLIRFALEATPPDILLVIRPHPIESGQRVPEDVTRALRSRGARISRAGRGPTVAALFERTAAVLTLTSAVGLEALLAGVPVFTLGPAFYQRKGMARAATMNDAASVRRLLSGGAPIQPDFAEVNRFVSWLSEEFIIPSPEVDPSAGLALVDRIRAAAVEPAAT